MQFFYNGGPLPLTQINDDIELSGAALAQIWACDERTVRTYAERNIAVKSGRGRYLLKASTRNLIEHLRETASGRGGHDAVESLTAERARLAKEQADGHALKNQLARGELIPAAIVQDRWSGICASIRQKMLAIPTLASGEMPAMSRVEIDTIDRMIRSALSELADGFENQKDESDV